MASSEPVSEVTRLEEEALEEVSGAGLSGLFAGAKAAYRAAASRGATSGEIVAAVREGAKAGHGLPSPFAAEAGHQIGIKHTI